MDRNARRILDRDQGDRDQRQPTPADPKQAIRSIKYGSETEPEKTATPQNLRANYL
jgi:hypothetical protein